MGCDIHVYCEYKRTVNNVKSWVSGDHYTINPYCTSYEDEQPLGIVHLYDGRGYELFSVLADVRNHSKNEPISQPRGIPTDSCAQIKYAYQQEEGDAHSASYFTLKELIDNREKYKVTKRSGFISSSQFQALRNGIKPDSWCQGTNQEGYVYAEWTEESDVLSGIIESMITRARELFHIFDFYKTEKVSEEIDKIADEFRIVFWFDN